MQGRVHGREVTVEAGGSRRCRRERLAERRDRDDQLAAKDAHRRRQAATGLTAAVTATAAAAGVVGGRLGQREHLVHFVRDEEQPVRL